MITNDFRSALISLSMTHFGHINTPLTSQKLAGFLLVLYFFILYLKPKVTLHCYYMYLFWELVSGILNVFIHIKLQSIIHMTDEFLGFTVINATTMPQWKKQGGKINFSKMHHFWMCYCSFAIGHFFFILKNQSEIQAIELLLKAQISPDHPSRNTN